MSSPIHELRIGLIKARIWKKHTRSGVRHTVSVVRLFKNGDVWKESTRFGRDDLPMLRLVLDRAYGWLLSNTMSQEEPRVSNPQAHLSKTSRTSP
jgi:hypothetical protein